MLSTLHLKHDNIVIFISICMKLNYYIHILLLFYYYFKNEPGSFCENNRNWKKVAPRSRKLGINNTYLEFSHSVPGVEFDIVTYILLFFLCK